MGPIGQESSYISAPASQTSLQNGGNPGEIKGSTAMQWGFTADGYGQFTTGFYISSWLEFFRKSAVPLNSAPQYDMTPWWAHGFQKEISIFLAGESLLAGA
jgi:hypothetical protein